MDSETSQPNLLCEEDDSSLNEDFLEFYSVSESDCEYIEMLFQTETNVIFQSNGEDDDDDTCQARKWLKCARSDAIKWILETRALFGYQYRTAYLSVIYFDKFLTRRWISDGKMWAIRILSIACLSLAAKMEECEVRAFSEYYIEGYKFQGIAVQRMELLVLTTLDWRMSCVTPFAYLNYFTHKLLGEFRHKELVTRAAELILAIMEEVNVVEHRPSIIAAAAVLAADDYQLTKKILENKMNAVPSWGSIEKEDTFLCYNLLQDHVMVLKTPESTISSISLPKNTINDSTIQSRGSIKRKLAFDDDDDDDDDNQQCCPPQKNSRNLNEF